MDILYIETPTNPLMLEFDIQKLAKLAHEKGAKVIVDNTFYSPIYQRPIEEGADIVLHSATKYLAGHNDVLAGVVVTDDEGLYEQLFYNLNTTGAVLSPFDSYQLIRGLKTLALRMERSTENAKKVVEFLKGHPAVKEVLYTGKGGMVSFKVSHQEKDSNHFEPLASLYLCRKLRWSGEFDYLPNYTDPRGYSYRGSSFLWVNG